MRTPRRNLTLALNLIALALGMLLLAYASVPLYRLFCEVTGYGGTTQRASGIKIVPLERRITVHFDAETAPGLPWKFAPGESSVSVRIGEDRLTYYTAQNLSGAAVTGHAVFNVVPHEAGAYFVKVECFCFQDQTLAPHQNVQMPVSFYIDPAIAENPELQDVKEITLSYTFFPATPSNNR